MSSKRTLQKHEIDQGGKANKDVDAHPGISPMVLGHKRDLERMFRLTKLVLDEIPISASQVNLLGDPSK